MTVEVTRPGRACLRAYFLPLLCEGRVVGDLWGVLYQDEGQPCVLEFRTRTYVGADPHSGEDLKSWVRATFSEGDVDAAVRACDEFWRVVAAERAAVHGGGQPEVTDLRGLVGEALTSRLLDNSHSYPKPEGSA